jgi:hypothetical protein
MGVNYANSGYSKRLEQTAFPATTQFQGFGNVPLTPAVCAEVGKNHMRDDQVAQPNRVWQWCILAQIRLPHLADVFNKLPLTKGARLRITIYFNSCDIAVVVGGGPVLSHTTTMRAGRCCPIMMSSAGTLEPSVTAAGTAGTATISCGVGSSITNNANGSPFFSSCRLYCPAYSMNPDYEERILAKGEKEIVYEDIQSFILNGSGTGYAVGGSQNVLLTNGLKSLERLIVLVQPNGGAGNANVEPLTSPWDSAPSTTLPFSSLSNLNVLVSGRNVFNQNLLYTFETFQQEVSKTGLNGGLTDQLSSGLISQRMFENGYAYYTVDLGRRLPADESVPMSVQLNFKNTSDRAINLYAFLVYRRKLVVNYSNGDVSER